MAEKKTMTLIERLAQFQAHKPSVRKNKVNPFTKSKYADLGAIVSAVDPVLNEYGLFLVQDVGTETIDGVMFTSIQTTLNSIEGEKLTSSKLLFPIGGSNPTQQAGANITYGRRYQICALLDIVADDDDDGNSVANDTKQSAQERKLIEAAEAAGKQGAAAYRDFFKKCDNAQRTILVQSGTHQRMKEQLNV